MIALSAMLDNGYI